MRLALGGVEGEPSLIDVGDHLIAGGGDGEAAGLDFVAGALLLALVAVEDAQRNGDADAEGVIGAAAFVLGWPGWGRWFRWRWRIWRWPRQRGGLFGGGVVGTRGEG